MQMSEKLGKSFIRVAIRLVVGEDLPLVTISETTTTDVNTVFSSIFGHPVSRLLIKYLYVRTYHRGERSPRRFQNECK